MSVTAILVPPAPELLVNMETVYDDEGFSSLILPHIILWDPLNQLSSYFPQGMLCPNCSQPLKKIAHWKSGQPRIIHDTHNTVLIVPAVYTCDYEHTLVATDPRILKIFTFDRIPFILLHRTGFTKTFINSIIQLLYGGMELSTILLIAGESMLPVCIYAFNFCYQKILY